MSPSETAVIVVITLWFAALGGCFGSLLNVLVYRLPRGQSIVYPPSSCPKCGQAIAWYDNIPIFGWLLLLGRCRWCRAPISIRYPIVEAVVTLQWTAVFLLLLAVQHQQSNGEWIDAVRALYERQSPLLNHGAIGIVFALYWLTGSILIKLDGQRIPRTWLCAGLVAIAVWIVFAVWVT